MKQPLAVVTLVLTVWSCGSTDRPTGGGTGGMEETGGSGGGGKGTGGSTSTGGSGTGGAVGTGGSTGSGGATATGGTGTSGGKDASADATSSTGGTGGTMSGDLWSKCGPQAYKPDVSAADFCARYISVCKASIAMDACVSMYNGLSDGPTHCRACTAYYACLAGTPEVMAMSCLYVMQGLGKNGPCKPSYCDQ